VNCKTCTDFGRKKSPVSREHREDIWNRFSELTKQMHDKRELLFEKLRGTELENLERKRKLSLVLKHLHRRKSTRMPP
jgi:hypothetical protein